MKPFFVVAILDTMYDWRGKTSGVGLRQAPRFFRINPHNHSGKRLYSLIYPATRLLVTDACRELVQKPTDHGTPDPIWLSSNLQFINTIRPITLLLVCGKVAQKTYAQCTFKGNGATRVIELPHPAARPVWTREYILQVQKQMPGL